MLEHGGSGGYPPMPVVYLNAKQRHEWAEWLSAGERIGSYREALSIVDSLIRLESLDAFMKKAAGGL